MVLNYVWAFFFLAGVATALGRWLIQGDTQIFSTIVDGLFTTTKDVILNVAFPLLGTMIFFLGLMNIAEKAGAVRWLARKLNPFLKRLFPEIPEQHPVMGEMVMNFSANMLGLDNAATPFGLKAMKSLEQLNPQKGRASNAQIMFLVLHTSGLTLVPLSIISYRVAATVTSHDPAAVFIPCVLATLCTTIVSMIIIGVKQQLRFDRVLIGWILGLMLAISGLLYLVSLASEQQKALISTLSGNLLLCLLIVAILIAGLMKKVPVFDTFVEGARKGPAILFKILPYLMAMLVAIRVFRDSGALTWLMQGAHGLVAYAGMNTDFVEALPVALMKPISGSGARGLLMDIYNNPALGPDSFPGKLASIFQGSADTTFYILALYFGSVGIRQTRYALWAGLLADLFGVLAAIIIGYIFFHS